MKKIANITLIVLMLVAIVPTLMWMFGVFGPFAHATNVFGGADVMLTIAAIYLGLGLLALIGLTLANMGKGRGNSRLGLYVFGGLLLLAIITYFAFAGADTIVGADGKVYDDVFTLKITDTMIYVTYAALVVIVVALLWGVVRKAIK